MCWWSLNFRLKVISKSNTNKAASRISVSCFPWRLFQSSLICVFKKERTRKQFPICRWYHYLLPGKVFRQASHVRCGERTDRTTHMLLAIVFVFLVTELPQGVMAVLSGMFSEEFRRHIYNNLGDILDLLSLCGACTTFIIYCSMSGQFRNVRLQLLAVYVRMLYYRYLALNEFFNFISRMFNLKDSRTSANRCSWGGHNSQR